MDSKHTRILLIEDDPDDALLIHENLSQAADSFFTFELKEVATLKEGLEALSDPPDIVLLDLSLPDSQGLETFLRAHAQSPAVPIVVLTGNADETFALEAVRQGAQDYLVKGSASGKVILRSIRYAIERNRTQSELRSLSLVDELTGLYNRRGFLTFAEQYLKLAQRNNKGMLLVYADLDNLKQINDTFGHHEGDLALIRTAKTLRETFRKSDIIARIGGDEFPVIAMEADRGMTERIVSNLRDNLRKYNSQTNSRYDLSLSIGVAYFDPDENSTIDDLMAEADEALYKEKRKKHPETIARA